ncbi:MAG: aspartyl protease family protein [bacterium]|nr:aspartyl protease family protein [bacterium]
MRHDRAAKPPATTEILGTVEGNALLGTFREYRQGAMMRSEIRLGPLLFLTVGDGKHLWESDENGDVRELMGVLRARATTTAFVEAGAYLDDPGSLSYVGPASSEGRPCYRFAVQAPHGDRQQICIDAQSYLLDDREFDEGSGVARETFFDYRMVDGYATAYRSVQSSGGGRAVTFSIQSVFENRPLDAALFAQPRPRYLEMPAQSVVVPMRLRRSGYEVPVAIGAHHYWFLLDSGSQGVVVDSRVARELNLRVEGSMSALGAKAVGGLGLARIDALSVGGAVLRGPTVGVLDFSAATGGILDADGVLGFPFFDAAVLRFDPHALTLEIEPPNGSGTKPRGERLAIELDRRIPVVAAAIPGNPGAPFLIDTGSSAELLLYQDYVDRHPGLVPVGFESRTGTGIGGALSLRGTTLAQLSLGSIALYNIRTGIVVGAQGAFADRFDAGNIGLGILRNFVITFDEPGAAIYLERGANFDDGRFRPQYEPLQLPRPR